MRKRLDQHLADEGVFESRARARAAVMEGLISVDGRSDVKPGTQVKGSERITVDEPRARFVSRGGLKLEGALDNFGLDVAGLHALDVGASTGGFTDCLLQRGAESVIALDVGKGQLHWKLRQDERVTVLEGFNARNLTGDDLPYTPELATVDVSFISLRKVVVPVMDSMSPEALILALVKPQFEAGVGKAPKGVVKDNAVIMDVLAGIREWLPGEGLVMSAVTPSPIRGPKGNAEFFMLVGRGAGEQVPVAEIRDAISRAPGR
ncbi:MAG: TlyA family RNA methyltransferase [Candidatus Geothermincolia bacterium]